MNKLLSTCIIFSLTCSNADAEIHRSLKAKNVFGHSHPHLANRSVKGKCSGYIIDHIKPLALGSSGSSDNMQWQTRQKPRLKASGREKAVNRQLEEFFGVLKFDCLLYMGIRFVVDIKSYWKE